MEMRVSPAVVFRFRRPSGSQNHEPSTVMTEALRQLSNAREMEPLLQAAQRAGREVVIDVFQRSDGQPLLIHMAMLPNTRV